jgi:hypothetical protein
MKNFARRIAVVIGAVAVSAGIMTTTAGAAHADSVSTAKADSGATVITSVKDSSWPW